MVGETERDTIGWGWGDWLHPYDLRRQNKTKQKEDPLPSHLFTYTYHFITIVTNIFLTQFTCSCKDLYHAYVDVRVGQL